MLKVVLGNSLENSALVNGFLQEFNGILIKRNNDILAYEIRGLVGCSGGPKLLAGLNVDPKPGLADVIPRAANV